MDTGKRGPRAVRPTAQADGAHRPLNPNRNATGDRLADRRPPARRPGWPRPPGWTAFAATVLAAAFATSDTGAGAERSDPEERECLALAVYWEAGGEKREGMAAVAAVVLNRRESPDFPATVCEVVREGGTKPGCQFTFWCDGKSETPRDADLWAVAQEVAAEALERRPPDPTGAALFFHAESLGAAPWKIPRERTTRIGRHVYYR